MKIRDIINNVVRTKDNEEWLDTQEIAQEFELFNIPYSYNDDEKPLKAYWAAHHLCTDTWVGIRVYYFHDKPVAISQQTCRKGDEDFEWVSEESYKSVRNWLLSLSEEEDVRYKITDLDEDMGDGYRMNYPSQILDDKVLYDGKLCDVIKQQQYACGATGKIFKIKTSNGEIDIDIEDCVVPWKVQK